MLTSIDLNNKSYGEMLAEAVSQIPRYSGEWTNYNVSDPGITLLQNLTAFNTLQEENISAMTDAIRRRLLALVGMHSETNTPAVLLAQTTGGGTLPAQYALSAGSLDFETAQETTLSDWQVEAYVVSAGGETTDITRLLRSPARVKAAVCRHRADGRGQPVLHPAGPCRGRRAPAVLGAGRRGRPPQSL